MRRPVMLLVAAGCVLLPAMTAAQGLTGALVGTVKDELGGVLQGARVGMTSPALIGGELSDTTNDKGQLRFPVLAPGSYALAIELPPTFASQLGDDQIWLKHHRVDYEDTPPEFHCDGPDGHATSVTHTSTTAAGPLDDSGNANPDFNLRYDASLGRYVFNLKTTGLTTETYDLNFTAGADPIAHLAPFAVK